MLVALSHSTCRCRHGLALPRAVARFSSRPLSVPAAFSPPPQSRGRQSLCQSRLEARQAAGVTPEAVRGRWAWTTASSGRRHYPPHRRAAAKLWGADSGLEDGQAGTADQNQFCVVNFYHLVDLSTPEVEVERHKRFMEEAGLNLKGRVYLSFQGVNAQYSGPRSDAVAYLEWLQEQSGFQDIRCHMWDVEGHQYPKLRIKFRRSLIQLAGGTETLPITDSSSRATPLKPSEWRQMLAEGAGGARRPLLLDVRNNYEWDAGHFKGSARPSEENFCETPATSCDGSGSDSDSGEAPADAGERGPLPTPLADADRDTPVMMYCTGGIRCDIYSTYLRQQGFKKLYTLEGGIANYLKQEGTAEWDGSLFVFDDRLAIGPTADGELKAATETYNGELLPAAVPCQLCGTAQAVLPHHNCANVLCNKLFIACKECRQRCDTCCCMTCTKAPRLRFRHDDGRWEEKLQDGEDYFAEMRRQGNSDGVMRGRVVRSPVVME
mmetsp:Transcript_17607/g.49216  ORF Transcript_17607/g.49216 Transcript_17607/m.49216 type:complete len:493 (-) Transcript_17607:279-1757(-)